MWLVFWTVLLLSVSRLDATPTAVWLKPGQTDFVDIEHDEEKGPVSIFCYKGISRHPWNVWRSVDLFIAFPQQEPVDKDDFAIFVGESPDSVYEDWEKSHKETTPISNLLAYFFFKMPIKMFYSSMTPSNSTLDRLLFPNSPSAVPLYPFKQSCAAIESHKSYTATMHVTALSPLLFFITLIGVVLFLTSPVLVSTEAFYYISASGFGIVSCSLIVLFVLFRFMPMRRPFVMIVAAIGSSALWIGITRRALDFLIEHIYIAAVCVVIAALAGFAFSYWYGPPTSIRVRNLISWFLQAVGLILIIFGTLNVPWMSILLILTLLVYRNRNYFFIPLKLRLMFYKIVPFKRRFLTMQEYERQGQEETQKQVEALRSFVNSPDCNAWELVQRLKDPVKFARVMSPRSTPLARNGSELLTRFDDSDDDDGIDWAENEDGDEILSSDED